MKNTAALLIATACTAADASYGAPAEAVPTYGPQMGEYGSAPYPQQAYSPQGEYESFIPPVVPSLEQPYPFTKFASEDAKDTLVLPHLGDHHCFLTGAPWTQCGRRSLTSYFLDQCMVFHQMMTKNVQGICFVPEAEPVYEATTLNEYGAEIPTEAAPADEYTGTGYGGAITDEYLKEKCLQKAFVSITAATVMCLTENAIRIKYIEHYAKDAATNPIEGPILYLKKLHTFIANVVECTNGESNHNYPNLWKTFKNEEGHVAYNPNAPFSLNSENDVIVDRTTSGKATGLESSIVGDKFVCSNVDSLALVDGKYQYASLPHEHHYSPLYTSDDTCQSSAALAAITDEMYVRNCEVSGDFSFSTGSSDGSLDNMDSGEQYLVDMSLRSLYDSVHYTEASITDIRRPLTIAELAVQSAGVLEQPILDGFGIMYFCAYHACKANNGGDVDGTCLPTFDAELDWELTSDMSEYGIAKESSERIEFCIEKKFLSNHEIADDEAVVNYKIALRRSHICMAETEIVRFMGTIYGDWNTADDAQKWVLGRHLATEKCYEEDDLCTSNGELYTLLHSSLASLVSKCAINEQTYQEKKDELAAYYTKYGHPEQKYAPAPAGYHPSPAAYAPSPYAPAPAPYGYQN